MGSRKRKETGKETKAAAEPQPWPNTLAAKVLAAYIHLKYDISASDLRFFNPPMGALPFFNNSASETIRHAELALVAASIMKFLLEIGIPFEKGSTSELTHSELLAVMEVETKPSSEMVKVLDDHYRFMDEA